VSGGGVPDYYRGQAEQAEDKSVSGRRNFKGKSVGWKQIVSGEGEKKSFKNKNLVKEKFSYLDFLKNIEMGVSHSFGFLERCSQTCQGWSTF